MFLINFLSVLTPVIKNILIFAGLLILPPPNSPGKPLPADRTDDQPRQKMFMLQTVRLIPLETRFLPSLLCRRPQFFINDRLMWDESNSQLTRHKRLIIRFLSVGLRFRYLFFSPAPHNANLESRLQVRW